MKYPCEVRFVIERLEAAGYEAYLVGGALRDLLLTREAQDFDVTTSATPSEMKDVFADCRVIETGLAHGTLTVIIEHRPIEITTFRVDGVYLDARHPESVRFTGNLAEDLLRRDFTINAMAYSEKSGLIDLYGGKEDLKNGLIRAVGEPRTRFAEDALRILRAFRFCSKLGFKIEEKTFHAIRDCREGLLAISAERIAGELEGILVGQNAHEAFSLMRESGVLSTVLPEARLDCAIAALPEVFETRLAFLLLGTQRETLLSRLRTLKLSNASISAVSGLVSLAEGDFSDNSEPSVRRLMAKTGEFFEPLMEILDAKGIGTATLRETAELCRARGDCLSLQTLALDGKDLLALGIKGKAIGETLKLLLEAVLDDPMLNERTRLEERLGNFLKKVP